jgi:hypothetical protein
MQGRTNDLLQLRPDIKTTTIKSIMSDEERFQNTVLRPIIKFQNDLFIEMFSNYIVKRKNVFFDLSLEKRVLYIENAIVKDMKFRNSLKGVIIGLFTVDEYKQYIKNSSALNKRMMNITKERLISNVQVFSPSTFIG